MYYTCILHIILLVKTNALLGFFFTFDIEEKPKDSDPAFQLSNLLHFFLIDVLFPFKITFYERIMRYHRTMTKLSKSIK